MKFFGKQINPQRIKAKKPPKINEINENFKVIENDENLENLENSEMPSTFEFKVVSEASLQNNKKKGKI